MLLGSKFHCRTEFRKYIIKMGINNIVLVWKRLAWRNWYWSQNAGSRERHPFFIKKKSKLITLQLVQINWTCVSERGPSWAGLLGPGQKQKKLTAHDGFCFLQIFLKTSVATFFSYFRITEIYVIKKDTSAAEKRTCEISERKITNAYLVLSVYLVHKVKLFCCLIDEPFAPMKEPKGNQ